jgi:hypothetical protein
MFQYLLDVCTGENLELNITHLNLDFEYAAHEAARHFWPDVTIKGCQFHWNFAKKSKILECEQ